ncbi:MAG: hypothetical protein AB7V18_04915 [Pyrinomonadaceae bacterium]|jgi:hypothetical protein
MVIGYRRVSRKSPCRICGKPDWCSTTVDQNISFCARSTTYADRLSRDGWGIYYNNFKRLIGPTKTFSAKAQAYSIQTRIAPIEHRHKIYKKLIQLSPLFKCDELISRNDGIRGGQIREVGKHCEFPKTAIERHRLVEAIIESFVREDGIFPTFKGVPGFWRGSNGRPRLGGDFDFVEDLILIPFIDPKGLIQACQIRCVKESSAWSGRYLWLSSIRQRDGCGPGTPLHHEDPLGSKGKSIGTVLVTEGALKAATVQAFLPDRYVVGNSGVATSHREIVKTARKKNLEIAFDADCFTNPHVARSLASLIALRTREQKFLSYDHPVRIITWDKRYKGIDDALIAGVTLKYQNVSEWLTLLTPDCFEAARHQLAGISL